MIMKRLLFLILMASCATPLAGTKSFCSDPIDTCLNLRLEAVGESGCRLRWDHVADCDWYVVECRSMNGALIFRATTYFNHFLDLSDKVGCQYRYQVRAGGVQDSSLMNFEDCGMIYSICKA